MDTNMLPLNDIILIVDDEAPVRESLEMLMEGRFRVLKADSGEKAIRVIRENDVDVVILDVMIPSPSGFEVCQQITCNPATHHIPVLMMSGLQDPTNWRRARELGAADFVTKPLQCDDVLARVRHFLAQAKNPKN